MTQDELREVVAPDIIGIMSGAYEAAISATADCDRCNGRGFHHGFGETGHDPDWCEVCGGAGLVPAAPDDRECWQRVLRAIEAAGYAVVPRDADIRLTDAGHVVHEVRGAPNDVWHSLLAAVLAASPPLAKET